MRQNTNHISNKYFCSGQCPLFPLLLYMAVRIKSRAAHACQAYFGIDQWRILQTLYKKEISRIQYSHFSMKRQTHTKTIKEKSLWEQNFLFYSHLKAIKSQICNLSQIWDSSKVMVAGRSMCITQLERDEGRNFCLVTSALWIPFLQTAAEIYLLSRPLCNTFSP